MARPVKSFRERRNIMLRLRMTTSEKQHLDMIAKESGFTVSDYIRKKVLKKTPKRSVPGFDREILLRLLAELNKEGSNLNQIARTMNIRQNAGLPPLNDDLSARLKQLFHSFDGLVRLVHSKLGNGH